jgi:hypothetical protein
VSSLGARTEEELAGHDLDIDPDGIAAVDQLGRKRLSGKAFGKLLGVDEGIGDPLAVVKHFGFIPSGGITVRGPEDNRHTYECTENESTQGSQKAEIMCGAGNRGR